MYNYSHTAMKQKYVMLRCHTLTTTTIQTIIPPKTVNAYVITHKIVATTIALFRYSLSVAKHPYSVHRHVAI